MSVDRPEVHVWCSAHWDGATLIFDSRVARGSLEGTNIVRYALSNDGKMLVAEERFRSQSVNYDNVWVLDRREPQ